jgi:hypothetical protein
MEARDPPPSPAAHAAGPESGAREPDPESAPPPDDRSARDAPSSEPWTCAVCFGALRQPVVTPCGHIFCWGCVAEWLRRSETCPACGGAVQLSGLIPVYGQGEAADLSGPPPPRPDYIPSRASAFFRWPFARGPAFTPFEAGAALTLGHAVLLQVIAIVLFFLVAFVSGE